MDSVTKELIAIGASVTANCQPCLRYHVDMAKKAGAGEEEIFEAADMGRTVRKGAQAKMDRFVSDILKSAETPSAAVEEGCGCGS